MRKRSKREKCSKSKLKYTINTDNIVLNSEITTKDIRDSLWRCRDFELSHLWQRSIFLDYTCFMFYRIWSCYNKTI